MAFESANEGVVEMMRGRRPTGGWGEIDDVVPRYHKSYDLSEEATANIKGPNQMKCEACLFFVEGTCRRYPPKVIPSIVPTIKPESMWPKVNAEDGCGEFSASFKPAGGLGAGK